MFKSHFKRELHRTVGLGFRKNLAVWIDKRQWLPSKRRHWWSQELVSDLAESDPNEYHKFLWSNHMSYARTYTVGQRFGENNLVPSRRIFLAELERTLAQSRVDPQGITSVFDVGCSLGYVLRRLEKGLFSRASRLEGIDIDGPAILAGQQYLDSVNSRIRVARADMEQLAECLDGKRYDVILCLGALMYLDEARAAEVVRTILEHTGVAAAFAGLASPDVDNADLKSSTVRDEDTTFVHNIDRMVSGARGRVIRRRWDGSRKVAGNTIYFVFAEPASSRKRRPSASSKHPTRVRG